MNSQAFPVIVCAAALLASPLVQADFANGPDPYSAGFGFDTPGEAVWGGWNRGDSGTLYAEWDEFGASNPSAPDVGVAGAGTATFAWNPGTFATGAGNLYNFGSTQVFTITMAGSVGSDSGPVTVALQAETWGTPLEQTGEGAALPPATLNGLSWDSKLVTYQDPAFGFALGPVLLEHAFECVAAARTVAGRTGQRQALAREQVRSVLLGLDQQCADGRAALQVGRVRGELADESP